MIDPKELRAIADNYRNTTGAAASNALLDAADIIERQKNALLSFIETIEATGGVNADLSPAGDPEWRDLGEAYAEACSVLGCEMKKPCRCCDETNEEGNDE
jgi:hypothetical protein